MFNKISAVFVGLLLSVSAAAMPIAGDIGFGGNWSLNGNTIEFDGDEAVLQVSGDLATTITRFDTTDFNDLTFDPFTPGELWSLGGFTFQLNSVNVVLNQGNEVTLEGMGMIMGNGFDPTATMWDLSTNNLTFSTSNVTVAPVGVPEPSAVALLGFGLLALGFAKKRQNRA